MNIALFDKVIAGIVKRGRLELAYHDGQRRTFGTPEPGFPEVAVRFTDAGVPGKILRDPRLGAGECYMDGRIAFERGDIMDLLALIRANQPWEGQARLKPPNAFSRLKNALSFLAHSFNRPVSARRNVAHHYDIGNELYRLMLDQEHMQYSCAYWPREDMTLEQAQEAKLAHIAAKLALAPGHRVLDIGCGWGGMAIYLARHADAKVLGITLSEEQLALARERAEAAGVSERVEFRLLDYRDPVLGKRQFDRIVSVGMFEHVGRPQFETFFRACANMLAPDGVMLLHSIGRMGAPGRTDSFVDKYIFPGGYIPALSETLAASERCRLVATDIETWRLHYAKTLRRWYAGCVARRDEIVAMYDERFFRMWCYYLAGATAAFESGGMCNYQIQYSKNRRALPLSRDYIAEREQNLLQA